MSDKEKPNIIKPAGAMAGATLISRILGLIREMCYARFMGDGKVAGAFLLAFMIPNLFRRLLGEGALSAAFIPIFKDKEINEGEEAMWRSAYAVVRFSKHTELLHHGGSLGLAHQPVPSTTIPVLFPLRRKMRKVQEARPGR